MARTAIAPATFNNLKAVTAGSLDAVEVAADTVNLNSAVMNGPLLLIAHNTHASIAYTVTVSSVADELGRTGDVATYSIAAGVITPILIPSTRGWQQADGNLYFQGANAAVKFSLYKMP